MPSARQSSGTPSIDAAASPVIALVTPTPCVTRQAPTWRVILAQPSAMNAAGPSWRVWTTLSPSSWAAW